MGSLNPGGTYIYERAEGKVYAREMGSTERKLIGWDYEKDAFERSIHSEDQEQQKWILKHKEEALWDDIRATAKQNETLQKVLDRAIMIYRLSKNDPV
jgi:hypothetical protein